MPPLRIAVLVKGYPRLSETFIAQELLGLEARGFDLTIWSLRQPHDGAVHPMHRQIRAPVAYLPEYLYRAPLRVLRGALAALGRPGLWALLRLVRRDLARDCTPNRVRRLGQALVLARELPAEIGHIHVHYLHTPASVARYAALLTGRSWSASAHAKDIWTTPDWELAEKLDDPRLSFAVTCTAAGAARLREVATDPDRVSLVYHGLDLSRFPEAPAARPPRDGADPADPLRLVTVGRAVAKKGFDDLLDALAALPPDLHWRLAHVGGGEALASLRAKAASLGLSQKVIFLGAKPQPEVVALLREADLFVLPSKRAPSGDRDGLPNVIMEAASQGLAVVATDFAGIPEFLRDGVEGRLVPPGDWGALSNAINLLARDPAERARLAGAALARLRAEFGAEAGFDTVARLLGRAAGR
ncbi:glycosyltransferase [Methylobacterium nonmethylotrophicum]|uniref:Colanic acid biosynthesis glycosyltransferase WcaL n=1 Tax=Methylobacterium nonmethylotrophicum TaxID=1141884 RepID=A0A4Z0NMI5_9HYPH|nr:glycosyltransferase [Methylobacterium nonmethylotrophicum]TGD97213.1 colanic acid biosynthesis glycosyltransferase WcaL [Methylobacterium nonmethylotrophicum]